MPQRLQRDKNAINGRKQPQSRPGGSRHCECDGELLTGAAAGAAKTQGLGGCCGLGAGGG